MSTRRERQLPGFTAPFWEFVIVQRAEAKRQRRNANRLL